MTMPASMSLLLDGLIDYAGFCAAGGDNDARDPNAPLPYTRITASDANARMQAEAWRPYALDVRTPREAEIVSLPFVDLLQPHRKVAMMGGAITKLARHSTMPIG